MSQDGCGAPVAQYLVPEPDQVSAPGSVAGRARLQVDGGPARAIQLQAEHLIPRGGEEFQLAGALRKHADAAQRGPGFDAHGAVPGRGQVGFEGDPQSLARVDPPHRALRAAQADLQDDPGVHGACKTTVCGGWRILRAAVGKSLMTGGSQFGSKN